MSASLKRLIGIAPKVLEQYKSSRLEIGTAKQGVLSEFLAKHESELENMLFTEFNIDIAKEVWQKEAFEEGFEEGFKEGFKEGREEREGEIAQGLLNAGFSLDIIANVTGFSRSELEHLGEGG